MLTLDGRALFVWRLFDNTKGQQSGVNCAVFRNEGGVRSSDLVREAEQLARARWGRRVRLYTYVDPKALRRINARHRRARPPGYCFLMAGWRFQVVKACPHNPEVRQLFVSKERGFYVLEKYFADPLQERPAPPMITV